MNISAIRSMVGFGALLCFFFYVRLHAQTMRARRAQEFLDRVEHGNDDPDILDDISPRYGKSRWVQQLLRDMPSTTALASVIDGSGLQLTVAVLLVRMLALFGSALMVGYLAGLSLFATVLVSLAAASAPYLQVVRAKDQRVAKLEEQLPQALELISLYLRSGRSLPQAFSGATEELLPPASEEFFACAEEYRLGRPLDAALRKMARRFAGSMGLRLFSIAVSVLGQTGGNLVEVLERIKRTLDSNITYILRLRAMTGEARMSAWILGALPGVFMLISAVSDHNYFDELSGSHIGRVVFFMLAGFWGGGIFWTRRLMNSNLA